MSYDQDTYGESPFGDEEQSDGRRGATVELPSSSVSTVEEPESRISESTERTEDNLSDAFEEDPSDPTDFTLPPKYGQSARLKPSNVKLCAGYQPKGISGWSFPFEFLLWFVVWCAAGFGLSFLPPSVTKIMLVVLGPWTSAALVALSGYVAARQLALLDAQLLASQSIASAAVKAETTDIDHVADVSEACYKSLHSARSRVKGTIKFLVTITSFISSYLVVSLAF